jgi:hypothetical protein
MVVIVLVVLAIYHFITNQTVLGRHIYAVGGNPEAAQLSGINVKRITYVVFGSMGMLSALSGILFASRLQSATTTAGTLFELDAIAAAYVGGVSAAGGVGKVVGSIVGALVMTSLISGMNLMHAPPLWGGSRHAERSKESLVDRGRFLGRWRSLGVTRWSIVLPRNNESPPTVMLHAGACPAQSCRVMRNIHSRISIAQAPGRGARRRGGYARLVCRRYAGYGCGVCSARPPAAWRSPGRSDQ